MTKFPLLRLPAQLLGPLILLAGMACVLDRLFPPDLSRLAGMGREIVDRQGRALAYLPAEGGVWRFRVSPDAVSPALVNQLVATEDGRFWWHPGVDPLALGRAAAQWVRSGRIVSGGSTLAMQAARLLEPRPRTLRAKLIEIGRAMQLEARYGRNGVLGIWLTLAPYGGNLEGVTAGALAWFGHGPERLEPEEAALLVAIPRRPEALRPDRHPQAAARARDRVLLTQAASPVPDRRIPLPRHAPQILTGLPREARVRTTLDLPLQQAAERLAEQEFQHLPPRASLAILIAETGSRRIRAIVAGDWGRPDRAGSVDLTQAIRSPGSALKPFIYGMAFEDGVAGPATMMGDLPRRFGGYAPENFDRGFAGSITAAEALQRSLNLPAVALLDRVGPLRFAERLRAAGSPIRLPGGAEPSLPLALGGGGVTLRGVTRLYAALAADGAAAPLRLTEEPLTAETENPAAALLSPAAAHLVADVLTRPFPAGGPAGVAWKTGTSWGNRDAWAFGFDARHVAGVWVGRPDGTPMPAATGASIALPLLARVFDLLPASPRIAEPPPPAPQRNRVAADGLRLLFPPPGAVLSQDGAVVIRAMGGHRPLAFLIDGAPIPAEAVRREAAWLPAGPGFYRLTVLDADGAAVGASVQIR